MNSEIEQRIVAMYFDNKDFEKNAKKTIDTLGELKENLNLEDSVKGFDELDKAGKKLNLSQARNTINRLKESTSGLSEGLKKAFNIGTAPLHALDNFFETFRGYVGKFLGFDLASKFVGSLESALRQLTVAPIEAGWSMYQANVDSTKTIMSGTLKSYKAEMSKTNADWTYDEAEHMAFVKEQLAELSSYAQKTVFSLSDMTNNVGKFTNNNIPLEDSVIAMEGIANMTAKAGQGADKASMAMYNFSQALGVGKMTTIDWKSIENANIATTELKDLFISTAEAYGKLHKEVTVAADGKEIEKFFITVDKNGKKLAKNKWIEVTSENFRDSLSNGWLDKETMLRVMQIYSGKVNDADTLLSWGFKPEQIEELMAIGKEAAEAATQVRTFGKMWDAMTESVQSGWADSMQYIFGDMLEATDFWTTVNDKIGSVLDKTAERRNNILREWRGMTFNEETGEWEKLEGAIDGREDLIQGIYGVIDAAKSLGSAFSGAWSDVFGNLTGSKLQEITKGFRDFIDRFKTWLGNMDDANSRLSKIRKGVSGVFSILKVGINILKAVFNIGIKAIKPLIDPLLNLFSKFGEKLNLTGAKNLGEMLQKLRDRFTALWSKLSEMGISGIFAKIGEKLSGLWESIKKGIGDFLDENGLSGVKEWFIQLGDKIKAGYETVKTWWEGSGIPEFFKGIWDAVAGLFATTDADGNEIEMPIVTFFKGIYNSITEAWESIFGENGSLTTWWNNGDNVVANFFKGIWDAVSGLFSTVDANGNEIEMPIVTFFKGIYNSITEAWDSLFGESGSLTAWWNGGDNAVANFFKGVWDSVAGLFATTDANGNEIEMPIVTFFKGIYNSITKTWDDLFGAEGSLTKWWNGGDNAVANFFKGVWESITGAFTPVVIEGKMGNSWTKDAPIVEFFRKLKEDLEVVWNGITGWEGWKEIGKFFSDIWGWIEGVFNGNNGVAETVEKATTIGATADTSEGEIKNTEESVGFIERIVGVISEFIGKVMSAVNGVVIPPEITTFFVNLGDVLKAMFGFVSEILGHLANMLNGQGSKEEWIVAGLGAFLAIVGAIFSYRNNKHLASIKTESIAAKFMALGVGMLAIASALALLTTIDQDKMGKAAVVLGGLMLIMALVVSTLTKKTAAQKALTNAIGQTPTERVITRLIGALEKVGMIAVALALLPNVIKAFGEAKKMAPTLNGEDVLQTLIGVAAFISAISLGLTLIDRVTGGSGINPIGAATTSASIVVFLTILLGGLYAVAGILDGIFGTENVVQTIEQGGQMLTALGGAISGLIGGLIGGFAKGFNMIMDGRTDEEKMDESLAILEKLGDKLEVFTTDKTSGIARILNLIGLLSQTMDDVPSATDFSKFTDSLEPLATSVVKFGLILSGFMVDENRDKIPLESMKERILALVEIMRAFDIPDMSTIVSSGRNKAQYFIEGIDYLNENMTPERFEAIGSFMANLTNAFNEAMNPEGQAMKTMSGDLMKNLSAAIKIGLGDAGKYEVGVFDAMPIIDSITAALGYGETAIATAVHNMVQAGINGQGKGGFTFETPELTEGLKDNDLVSSLLGSALDNENSGKTVNELSNRMNSLIYGEGGNKDNPKEDSLFGILNGFQGDMEEIEFPDMGEKLAKSFSFKDAETGEDLDLTTKLKETLAGFEKTLNEETEFEIKIVPSFDLKNLNEQSLRKALGDYPVGLPLQFSMPDVLTIDFTGMAAELNMDDIRTRIDQVTTAVDNSRIAMVDAITNMGIRIDNLGVSIRQLKLYLDTGALVGGITPMIDRELGKRANWADGGATPIDMLMNPFALKD